MISILKAYGIFQLLASITSDTHFIHAAIEANARLLPAFIGAAALFIVLVIACFWPFNNIPYFLRPRKLDPSSDLPYLDMEKLNCAHRPSLS